jgi:hypothetical protein
MVDLTFPILPDGLWVRTVICASSAGCQEFLATGKPVPAPITVNALIDTAADLTGVSSRALQRLGLSPLQSVQTNTAAGPLLVGLFEISLSVMNPALTAAHLMASDLLVTELPHAPPTFDVLIGLNLLRSHILHIDGPGGLFTLTVLP